MLYKKKYKMGFLKKLLFEEVTKVDEISPPVVSSPTITTNIPVIEYATPAALGSTGNGIPEAKFIEKFNSWLEEADLPGPDYLEFRKKFLEVSKIPGIQESVRYPMVYATMVGDGLTKQTLLESIPKYLTYLAKRHEESLTEFEIKREKEIKSRENKINLIDKENEDANKQIAELSKLIQLNQEKRSKILGEITEASSKIDDLFKNYEASYNQVISSINEDKRKIEINITIEII